MALTFRCGHKNDSGLVTVEAPYPLTVSAGRGFVDLLSRCHGKNTPALTTYLDNRLKKGSFIFLIKVPMECIKKLSG